MSEILTNEQIPVKKAKKPGMIIRSFALVIFNLILLYILLFQLSGTDVEHMGVIKDQRFGKGNAPDSVRIEILAKLNKFQEGYTKRDPSVVSSFTSELFTENILVLGTMPREVRIGIYRASQLIEEDWQG